MTLLVASLVAGVGVAGPAIALATFAAQTGRFGDPSTSTEEDPTEWLDLSASDLPDAVAAAYPAGLQLPPGADASEAVRKVQSIFGRFAAVDSKTRGQERLATTTYEFWATCAWTNESLITDDLTDIERRGRAGSWLGDPENFPSIVAHDGGGVLDPLFLFADAAAQGNRDTVETLTDKGLATRCSEPTSDGRVGRAPDGFRVASSTGFAAFLREMSPELLRYFARRIPDSEDCADCLTERCWRRRAHR